MEIEILKKDQIVVRLNPDLRDNIAYLYDVHGYNPMMPQKEFVTAIVEMAVEKTKIAKASQPADIERIAKLEAENSAHMHEINKLVAELRELSEKPVPVASDQELTEAMATIERLVSEIEVSEQTIQALNAKIDQLLQHADSNTVPENTLLVQFSPVEREIIDTICSRLSVKYKKEVSPAMLIKDYIIRYNTERRAEWFHPFVLPPAEIRAIVKKHSHEPTA